MQFTYTYLKNARYHNVSMGTWKGCQVKAALKREVSDCNEANTYYVIYDDNNIIYKDGYIYGTLSENGNVNECRKRAYRIEETPKKEKEKAGGEAPAPAVETSTSTTGVMADVQLEILVEDTLKGAREMSIDSLLEGFDYGL